MIYRSSVPSLSREHFLQSTARMILRSSVLSDTGTSCARLNNPSGFKRRKFLVVYNIFSVKTFLIWKGKKLFKIATWIRHEAYLTLQLHNCRWSFHTISRTHCSWFSDSFWSFSVQLAAAVQRVLLLYHCLFGVDSIDFGCDSWIPSTSVPRPSGTLSSYSEGRELDFQDRTTG